MYICSGYALFRVLRASETLTIRSTNRIAFPDVPGAHWKREGKRLAALNAPFWVRLQHVWTTQAFALYLLQTVFGFFWVPVFAQCERQDNWFLDWSGVNTLVSACCSAVLFRGDGVAALFQGITTLVLAWTSSIRFQSI